MCFSALVKQDLKLISQRFGASVVRASFDDYEKMSEENPKKYKKMAEHPRIYPGYYAPLILWEGGRRVIKPFRYRLRPHWAEKEIPSKYNLFNARLDALETRKSWQPLFMKQHGLLVFERFFEWVERDGKKTLISFAPDHELMWAPCLWDSWSDGTETIHSFAMITTDPPPEISEMGHDRCPVFLKEELIDTWLKAEGSKK